MRKYTRFFETGMWIAGLLLLALMPVDADPHYSLCFFKYAGLSWCPGCGLGHSISYLFHGDWRASFHAHPLGLPAVLIILYRIYILFGIHLFPHTKIATHG